MNVSRHGTPSSGVPRLYGLGCITSSLIGKKFRAVSGQGQEYSAMSGPVPPTIWAWIHGR